MASTDREVALRIAVRRPPTGVTFAVQRGAAELIPLVQCGGPTVANV